MMERAAPWNLFYPSDWEECESKSTSASPGLPIYSWFTAEIKLIWRSAQPESPSVNKWPVTKWNRPDCTDTFYNTINGCTETHQGNKSSRLWPEENLANICQGYEVLQNCIKICKYQKPDKTQCSRNKVSKISWCNNLLINTVYLLIKTNRHKIWILNLQMKPFKTTQLQEPKCKSL